MAKEVEYADGLVPKDVVDFIKFAAILGFLSSLALVSALVYKGIQILVGEEKAKNYKWVVLVVDVLVLLIFIFIYLIFFRK